MKRLMITLLGGRPGVDRIRRLLQSLTQCWLSLAVRSTVLSRLHYAFFSSAFDQEARAVIAGQLQFLHNRQGTEPVNYFLRRAVHRLEKGLIMEPRRELFALDYIQDVVEAYDQSLRQIGPGEESRWARDVLDQYFQAVSSHPVVDKARKRFEKILVTQEEGSQWHPYRAIRPKPLPVSYEQMLALAKMRRSVRWYQSAPVPREDVDDAIRVALQSPSACNRQPYRFLVFDEPASIAEVATLPGGVKGFEHNFPMLIAVVGRLRAYPEAKDRHVIYVDGALAAMSFMFALESKGLSSCSINWPDIKAKELKAARVLNLDRDERIILFMSVGYAREDGLIPYSQKLPLADARQHNPSITSAP